MKKMLRGVVKSFAYGQKGFTLVELLVVVAILGILAAVAVPSLTGLTATAKENAKKTELSTVQTAMDAMMADQSLSVVTAVPGAISDMTAFPTGNPLSPNYLRSATTHGTYTCVASGLVAQASYP
ncbi:MAG: type II secretion system protein [Dehalococcoidia bacterium]|nr:type II secretion system protein [Dehalococcoidia bacterium]